LESSPNKRQFTQKLDAAYTNTPPREGFGTTSPSKSVKKLASRRTSERKAPKSASRRASVLPPEDEMRRLLSIFQSLKKV